MKVAKRLHLYPSFIILVVIVSLTFIGYFENTFEKEVK